MAPARIASSRGLKGVDMPFLPEPRELEQRAFEDPPPPSRPRMSAEEADELENADEDPERWDGLS
jgi:hypothetical protein